jgi:hypothetical protein
MEQITLNIIYSLNNHLKIGAGSKKWMYQAADVSIRSIGVEVRNAVVFHDVHISA